MAGNSSATLTCELKKLVVLTSVKASLEGGSLSFSKYLENPLSMSHIDFTSSSLTASTSSEINIYVPIVVGSYLIEYAMLGWIGSNNIAKLFKIFGNNEGTYGFTKSTKLGGTSLADDALNLIDFDGNNYNWKVKDNGCVPDAAGYSTVAEIIPANLLTEATMKPTITGCTNTMKIMNTNTGEANLHFIVHSFKKFWSGNITWGLYSDSAEY